MKIYAEIEVNEEEMSENEERNGIGNLEPIEYLEKEFGWLEQNGITLQNAIESAENDSDISGLYAEYIVRWGITHLYAEEAYESPMTIDEWAKENDCEKALAKLRKCIRKEV